MNADKHRYFLAFAYGETNSKRVYLRSSVDNKFLLFSVLFVSVSEGRLFRVGKKASPPY